MPTTPPDEQELLRALLFDKDVSRNRLFALFEEADAKRLHRLAKLLRSLHKDLHAEGARHWVEPTGDGGVCLHIHRPEIGARRQVQLTTAQWELLQEGGFC